VGVVVSQHTGDDVGWTGKPYGYAGQLKLVPMLRSPEFTLVPIVEPGERSEALAAQLAKVFPGVDAVDGSDAAALRKLDVIVANETWQTTPAVVEAIHVAVSEGGVGLYNGAGLGTADPGFGPNTPLVATLAGLKEGQYAWNPKAVACEVLEDEALLGHLGEGGKKLDLRPNGAYGIPVDGATPLIKVADPASVFPVGDHLQQNAAYVFYPLLLASDGKGRIVACNWAPFGPLPAAVKAGTNGDFPARCVRWLARREVK
jgi:hypothetical protein